MEILKGFVRLPGDIRITHDTGDRVLTFKKLFCHIPSYLKIRGYWAYVRYPGQPVTCRLCSETGHFAVDCSRNPRKKRKAQNNMNEDKEAPKTSRDSDKEPGSSMDVQDQPTQHDKPSKEQPGDQPAAEDMEVHVPEPDPTPDQINSTPTIQEEDPEFFGKPNSDPKEPADTKSGERSLDKFVSLEDCTTPSSLDPEHQQGEQETGVKSQDWADFPEGDASTEGSEKPQEDSISEPPTPGTVQKQIFGTDTEISDDEPDDEPENVLSISGNDVVEDPKKSTAYCPQCREYTHTEEECTAAVLEQANKKALSTKESKKNKQDKSNTGKRTLNRFRNDLDHVVMRGRCKEGLEYIHELEDRDNVFDAYLFFTYGDYNRACLRDIRMSGNKEVMDLWRRFSRGGMNKDKAEDLLRGAHCRI